ncbi:MAG: D-tyrosyl-tRNA(Tyr) deacylase [Bacteroidales bacterium]|nr:D-tyrosyl-tRNA(Tyr) deacylase [Bacteroidales bacterium]
MRAVIQRVKNASVVINGVVISSIGEGLLIFIGIQSEDNENDIIWLSGKIARLRIFSDPEGLMNLSVLDVKGKILLVSQFTLYASTKKGNRPSYINSAKPEIAIPLYNKFILQLEKDLNSTVKTGEFGANMQISLINDGPVTIIMDTKNKE